MKHFIQNITLMGEVLSMDVFDQSFELMCRSQDSYKVRVRASTEFNILRNLDNLDRDRLPNPDNTGDSNEVWWKMKKHLAVGRLIVIEGVYQELESQSCFDAVAIHILNSVSEAYSFEDSHWWLAQITLLADEWLDDLFGTRREYKPGDFAERYHTNLNILGEETDENIQECATLSRLIYGLSSVYLLTGSQRFLLAARAGVQYQRETFRSLSHDGKYCFWAYGWKRLKNGSKLVIPSQNPDDLDSIPLYEQIYALAGLAQYYRITQEWEVLDDIERTINAFNDFYLDDEKARSKNYPGYGGYFSHIDYVTMRPDTDTLGKNKSRKNWNSIGDHIPAYLTNLLLALDPLPKGDRSGSIARMKDKCQQMLEMTSSLIVDKFPDPDPEIPYVNERFHEDWKPDQNWGWQQNRAIVGHNLKIAWNLTRCGNYLLCKEMEHLGKGNRDTASQYASQAQRYFNLAVKIGDRIATHGVDDIHGGLFDAVERKPGNGMPIEVTWNDTKDFWQQEQAVLAYLILHGVSDPQNHFLKLAQEMMAFWNLYFLDRDNRGIYFRVNDNGHAIVKGQYANKGGHSISGYHAFELNYLAHIYISTYIAGKPGPENNFTIYFQPSAQCGLQSVNVLPDFFKPGDLEIASITINGIPKQEFDRNNFQIALGTEDLGKTIAVEFYPMKAKS
jgi:mannose/cellobiose epimerase-like protein (N-acyl-D-glucosamine 2-epimerase family)